MLGHIELTKVSNTIGEGPSKILVRKEAIDYVSTDSSITTHEWTFKVKESYKEISSLLLDCRVAELEDRLTKVTSEREETLKAIKEILDDGELTEDRALEGIEMLVDEGLKNDREASIPT